MNPYEIWKRVIGLLAIAALAQGIHAESKTAMPTPPDVWKHYNPDAGDFKEEIIAEQTRDGIYYRESYISAYVLGEEIRVYCKYSVKEGAKKAPGLMDVHGWMGQAAINRDYVNDGWAVMAHDYCGKTGNRPHYTKYPEKLRYGNMDAQVGYRVKSKTTDKKDIIDPAQTDDYLWYAIQRRTLSYLLAQKEVDQTRIGAKGFSYGGTLMWNLGMDPRVKAVVAYFGIGYLEYYRTRAVWMYNNPYVEPNKTAGEQLYLSAIAPQAHAPHISAATLWLNGSNDHHGGHERGCEIFKMFKPGVPWDFAIQARGHHNTEKLGDNCKLWLEKHVLGKDHFWPDRPRSEIKLGSEGVPELHLSPASPHRIKSVQIYQCLEKANNVERYWRDVEFARKGDSWIAKLPVMNVKGYVFSYANIRYNNNSVISSNFEALIPSELGNAVATDMRSEVLPGGADRWSDAAPAEGVGGISGFRPINNHRGTLSNQFADPKWKAPRGARLAFSFYCTQPQKLVLSTNGGFESEIDFTASDDWQQMTIEASQLKRDGKPFGDWSAANNIRIKPKPGEDITQVIFSGFSWIKDGGDAQAAHAEEGRVRLTRAMATRTVSFLPVKDDVSVAGTPISIGGRIFTKGLGVHAESELTFPLNGKYSNFHVIPGPDDAHHGYLEMTILVDDKEVFASGKTRRGEALPKPLDIPVKGAKTLTLKVGDGGDGNGGDHASWADAYLEK